MNKDIDALVAKYVPIMALSPVDGTNNLRAALLEARALGLEEAAKVCDHADKDAMHWTPAQIAAAIRALKGE